MIIPNDGVCRNVLDEMEDFLNELTDWEYEFVVNNNGRKFFTPRQREIIARFADKYDLESLQ